MKTNFGFFIESLIGETQKHIGATDKMIMATALSYMSTVVGARVHTHDGSMNRLNMSIWTLLVAPSTISSKSTTIKFLRRAVMEQLEKKLHESSMVKIEQKTEISLNGNLIKEVKQIILGAGSTYQGIIKFLQKAKHGVLMMVDEASEMLTKLNKNQEAKASITSLYDGERYVKSLVGQQGIGEEIVIENPCLPILMTTNPEWLRRDVKKADIVSGFLNRFIIVTPPASSFEPLRAFSQKGQQPELEKFQQTSIKVLEWLGVNYNQFQQFESTAFEWSNEAIEIYQNWFNKLTFDLYLDNNNDGCKDGISASSIRQAVSAIKYAILCQIFDNAMKNKSQKAILTPEYIRIGINIAEVFIQEVESLLASGIIDNYKESPVDREKQLCEKIEAYLHKKGIPLTRSELTQNIRGLDSKNFDDAIAMCYRVEKISGKTPMYKISENAFMSI